LEDGKTDQLRSARDPEKLAENNGLQHRAERRPVRAWLIAAARGLLVEILGYHDCSQRCGQANHAAVEDRKLTKQTPSLEEHMVLLYKNVDQRLCDHIAFYKKAAYSRVCRADFCQLLWMEIKNSKGGIIMDRPVVVRH